MGNAPGVPYDRYCEPFNEAMIAADCTTVKRAAMWCAQLGEESGGLRWMRELASGSEYEGRADLGNTQPGDGVRYAGRGPIQLTGRSNYGAFSRWAASKGFTNDPNLFVNQPALLEDPKWGLLAATYYWTVARPQINSMCDSGDVVGVTRAINGGTNGLADRQARYNRCIQMGAALLPQGGFMAALNDDQQRELYDNVKWLRQQLDVNIWGPDSDLGKNAAGQNYTFRDSFADFRRQVLAKFTGGK
jgi:predicted chitinase